MKRKMTKKERSERARVEAENSPIVRQLRQLYERGMADLAERRLLCRTFRRGEEPSGLHGSLVGESAALLSV